MRILVTGGAGFIGSNLVDHLLEIGRAATRVVTLDKLTYAGNRTNLAAADEDPRHRFVEGDICDRTLVASLLREEGIDSIIHLAAESHLDRSIDDPEEFIMTNLVGTYRLLASFHEYLLETQRLHDPECRFLNVSTDEVFGSLDGTAPAFNEHSPHAPNSPYSASKAGGDHLVRAWHRTYGLPAITTNCSNNYGPRQFPEKLIPLMIRKALKGQLLPLYGDGLNVRDWLHVRDHCRALSMCLLQGEPGGAYLIGGDCELRNIDVVRAIVATLRELAPDKFTKSAEELISHVMDRPGHDRRYAIDSSRIRAELGWRPRVDFSAGLRETVRWYLENEDWIRGIEDGSYRGERLGTLG